MLEMIFFDMGGTLDFYPRNPENIKRACLEMQEILTEAGAPEVSSLPPDEFRELVLSGIARYKQWRERGNVELSPEELWRDFILCGFSGLDNIINDNAEKLTFLIDTGFVNRVPREELREVLDSLKGRNLRMGIISNVLSRNQVSHDLSRYGVTEYFDTVVLSAVFGKRKPHPEIFLEACRKASVKPENVLFIGNSPSKDINGAKGAGMGWTVLIEYEFTPGHDTGFDPDYRISNLRELIPVVEVLLSENGGSVPSQDINSASCSVV